MRCVSLYVAILTAVLLQVKPSYRIPIIMIRKCSRGSTDVFQGFATKTLTLQICLYWAAVLSPTHIFPEAPYIHVKYVAHRASCYFYCLIAAAAPILDIQAEKFRNSFRSHLIMKDQSTA